MTETLKIVVPMAGYGTRLRPHTWSRPKQLVSIAGKSVLEHVLDMFSTLPDPINVELIFIVGYLGEKVEEYIQQHHPEMDVKFVEQPQMRGQSHAIHLAKEHLSGPMLMVFADTLIETDLSSWRTKRQTRSPGSNQSRIRGDLGSPSWGRMDGSPVSSKSPKM